jgi:hypothetical protein
MKKIVFIFGCISTLIGLVTIITTSILNEVMPKLGRVAYQAAAAGSYSSDWYTMDFGFPRFLAVAMIIFGAAVSVLMYMQSKEK